MRLRRKPDTKEWLEAREDLAILEPKPFKGRWQDVFGNDCPIHVELGTGKGKFISELSAQHPQLNFIGVDMYDELIRRAGEKALEVHEANESEPSNLRLIRCNIEHIEELFAEGEVTRFYLNFSDPWPKKRHAPRRLTHPVFLEKYKSILNEWGDIHFKTDSMTLFEFSLNAFADLGLQLRNISLDLHREGTPEGHVFTEYELKFSEQGMPIYRCEVIIGSRALEEHRKQLAAEQ